MAPIIDFTAIPAPPLKNLAEAIETLLALYSELDGHLTAIRAKYPIPCAAGCAACCHEAVFLTPLEFWAIIYFIQKEGRFTLLKSALEAAKLIYKEHAELIEAFNAPPPSGEKDHFSLAKDLHYVCPFLREGTCSIYPARSLIARLFGLSFERPGVVYGCQKVEKILAASRRDITLASCDYWINRLKKLPYTEGRQVLPYYMVRLFGLAAGGPV